MKKNADYLEKMRFHNMILLVLAGISTVIGATDLPVILVKEKQIALYQKQMDLATRPELVEALQKSLDLVIHPLYRIYSLAMFIFSLLLFVGFYTNNKGLKTGHLVNKWPYYGHIGKILLAMFVSVITQALAFDLSTTVLTLFLNLAWCLPAIFVLKHRRTYLATKTTN